MYIIKINQKRVVWVAPLGRGGRCFPPQKILKIWLFPMIKWTELVRVRSISAPQAALRKNRCFGKPSDLTFFVKKRKKPKKKKYCIYRFAECFLCISCVFGSFLKNKSHFLTKRKNGKTFYFLEIWLFFFFFPLWRNFCVLFSSNPHPSSPVRKFTSPAAPKPQRRNTQTRAKNILFFFVKSITIQKDEKK